MGTNILNVGVTGLNAAQAGIQTAGHNIANASTPGYSRQQIVQSFFTGINLGYGHQPSASSLCLIRKPWFPSFRGGGFLTCIGPFRRGDRGTGGFLGGG